MSIGCAPEDEYTLHVAKINRERKIRAGLKKEIEALKAKIKASKKKQKEMVKKWKQWEELQMK